MGYFYAVDGGQSDQTVCHTRGQSHKYMVKKQFLALVFQGIFEVLPPANLTPAFTVSQTYRLSEATAGQAVT